MGRSPTINVRHIDRLVVDGKTSAASYGHPHEGMSSARSATPVIVVDDEPVSREATFSADSYALAKRGQNRRAIRIGRKKQGRSGSRGNVAGSARRHFGDPFVSRQQRAARGAHRQLIPSVVRGLKPNPFGQQRLMFDEFPLRPKPNSSRGKFAALRRPPHALRPFGCRPPGSGLFCAAPRGTRWRWASGPRRKKKVLQNGFQPLQVLPQA